MANSKISALTAQTTLASTDMMVVANAASTTKKITITNLLKQMPGYEFDYVQRTTDFAATATSAATAGTMLTGASVTYDGSTTVMIHVFCQQTIPAGILHINLWEDGVDIGRIVINQTSVQSLSGFLRRTPTAGSHQYVAKGWRESGDGTFSAGSPGVDNVLPTFLRITRAA